MATMDNVIPFPEGARTAEGDPQRILAAFRDQAAQKLRAAVRAALPELQELFASRGDVADSGEARKTCYGLADFLRGNAGRIEALAAAQWQRLFDAACRPRGDKPGAKPAMAAELELVDLAVMDEDIAVRALAARLHDGCEDGLYALGRRLAHLLGREEEILVVEKIVAETLQAALRECDLDGPMRTEVLRAWEPRAAEGFAEAIRGLNAFLVGRNVLPGLRRKYARPAAERRPAASPPPEGDLFGLLRKLVSAGGGAPPDPLSTFIPAATAVPGEPPAAPSMVTMAAIMARAMATLDALQQSVPTIGTNGPSTAVLRDFRASTVGQSLAPLDAVTVDIVATLFDFIFDDAEIADPIKALVARLQIPILKVAMLDKEFFSSKAHPARRLLDGISKAAARCGPSAGHDDPLYRRLADIVERLQAGFSQDTGLFATLCNELDEFLDRQEKEAEEEAERVAPLVAERERREIAAVAADEVLSAWLSGPLPAGAADLLAHEWRALLIRLYLDGDDAGWHKAVATAAELVASVAPQADAPARKTLAARLPELVRRIHDGLDRLHVAAERRMALLDCLFSIHAAVLRGAAPAATTTWPRPQAAPALVSESVEGEGKALECIALVDADEVPAEVGPGEAAEQVDRLRRGDWVEFRGEAEAVRYRLSWISPERGILLFTNPASPRAIAVAPAALAVQIERGEAAVVPLEPIFDRAVSRAMAALQAA